MIFMAQVYHSIKLSRRRDKTLDKRNSRLYSGPHPPKKSGLASAVTLANPTQPTPIPVKNEESTMPDNTNTDTHAKGETAYAIVNLTPSDLEPKDWAFLREWANRLGVSLEVLLKRILIAAVIGQLYAEKIPEI
jgi:hypothetical protein